MVYAIALLIALCIGGGIGFMVSNRDRDPPQGESENGTENGGNGASGSDSGAIAVDHADGGVVTIPDDGRMLWAAPVAGEPIEWRYLPARAEIVLVLRPAELLRHAEGAKIISALGPAAARAWEAAEADIKMRLADVEQLMVAWTNVEGSPVATYVVRPSQPVTAQQLALKWPGFQAKTEGTQTYFVDGSIGYAIPAGEQGRFVISSAALLPELLDADSVAAPLRREVLKLVKSSNANRLATLLFTRSAVLVDLAARLAAAGLGRLHDTASWMLREDVQAAALSFHIDENCYLEARLAASAQSTTPEKLAAVFRERMKGMADGVEDYISRIGLHPHGGKVLIRLDDMARFVEKHLRIGAEDEQVVINCYLPAVAAHNLVLGAELAISQPAGSPPEPPPTSASTDAAATTTANQVSVAEKLGGKMSLSFERETLERAIQLLSAEAGVPMEIVGGDLQVEGITKNQSFRLQENDKPAAEILRKIMLLANPDGKLVYVVKPRPAGGEEAVFITTRAAAQKRGDRLPPEVATAVKNKSSKSAK
jgi:hypothetical protein